MTPIFSTGTTNDVITISNAASSATTFVYTLQKARSPSPAPKSMLPKLLHPTFRPGQRVRVLSDGLLHNRVGTIGGSLSTPQGPIWFVGWSDGGYTTFREEQLEAIGERKKPKR